MNLFFFVILFLIELIYFRIADKFNIIDKPNDRSSHTKITLRGGGVIFFIAYLLYFLLYGFQYPYFAIGLALIALISFADDIKPQSSKLRLLIHFVSMGFMFYELGFLTLPWYFTVIAFVFATGVINAYNFMDGINGITGAYSVAVIVSLWYINTFQLNFVDNNLLYVLLQSLIVFNIFNFRKKAKCFAGDVGAISIAFAIVFLLGKLILATGDFTYIALLAVYGVDSILTIIHRILLKENIFDAHRKHLYQILANELKIPHLLVSSLYFCLQLLISYGLILLQNYSITYFCVIIILLVIAYILFKKKYFHLHKI